jgi:small-conductance mechanosensitive channel
VLNAQREVLREPAPSVLFRDFADSALIFEARFFITVRNLQDKLRIESDIRFSIDDRFREDGIVIAFPQRDLHLDTSAPIEVKLTRE